MKADTKVRVTPLIKPQYGKVTDLKKFVKQLKKQLS